MKATILFFSIVLLCNGIYAQHRYTFTTGTGNPGGLNTEGDMVLTDWTEVTFSAGDNTTNNWSDAINFPTDFEFLYMGGVRTKFQVSKNGCITFWSNGYTPSTALPGDNTNPPPTSPRNMVFVFWDSFTTDLPLGDNDKIYYKVFGTAPNRQVWVKWFSYKINTSPWAYFSAVFEEQSSKIYMVDQYSSGGALLTGSIGIWDWASGDLVAGSPNLTLSATSSANTDNVYYAFDPIPPSTPPTPSKTVAADGCGAQVLTRGNPTYPITYYWQGTSCGTSKTNTDPTYSATSDGTYYLRAYNELTKKWSIECSSVSVSNYKPRADQPTFTVSDNVCGTKTLTRTSTPDGYWDDGYEEEWYERTAWQDNSCGEKDDNQSESYLVNTSGTYYLRSFYEVYGMGIYNACWSECAEATVVYNPHPSPPPTPDVSTNSCGDKTLTRATPPGGITYYWQTTASGTSTDNSLTNWPVANSGIYYLRARSSAGCWSTSSASVSVTVNSNPDEPPVPTQSTNLCGPKTLTRATPPSGVTYYWQTAASGTDMDNPDEEYLANNSGNIYLRARSNAGCWSNATSVSVSINDLPSSPPTPDVSTNLCGPKTISREMPPSGVSYYWQTSASGESVVHSDPNYPVATSGMYYLRSRSDAGCWSELSSSLGVTVNPLPDAPQKPTISDNECGPKTLTRATPPSNTNYYWQNSLSGQDITNDSLTYSVSIAGNYYIRAYSDAGCWSANSTTIPVNIFQIPETPPVPDVSTNYCGDKTITRANPPFNVTYFWQNENEGSSIFNSIRNFVVIKSGTYYLRAQSNDGGCWSDSSTSVDVVVRNPYQHETICMVSSDPETGKNIVVWEKTYGVRTKAFNVYKETSANQYTLMGTVPFDSVPVFEDTLADPRVQSFRYKISLVDSCDIESEKSDYHQTIHLNINKAVGGGVNLQWNHYVDETNGIAFGDQGSGLYYIYRGSNPDSMILHHTLPTSNVSWTDLDTSRLYYYRIAVEKNDACDPAGLLKASSGPFSQSISNIEDNRLRDEQVDIPNLLGTINSLKAYPNPFKDRLQIEYTLDSPDHVLLTLVNIHGKQESILASGFQHAGTYTSNYRAAKPGVYILRLQVGEDIIYQRVVGL